MGFLFNIYSMKTKVCINPWCKGHFTITENDIIKVDGEMVEPKQCKKCYSFNSELSGGVTWQDKTYEGSRYDGMPHEIRYKVTNFKF